MSTRSDSQRALPVGFRGYDRAATDALLASLEEGRTALAGERDELRAQVEELTRELGQNQERMRVVADALVTAQLIAVNLRESAEADIENERREAAEERQQMVDEGAAIRAKARQQATEIIREARIRADRLIDEVVAALVEYRRDTDQFLDGTRERLDLLVRDLLDRIPGSASDYVPVLEDAGTDAESDAEAPPAGAAAA